MACFPPPLARGSVQREHPVTMGDDDDDDDDDASSVVVPKVPSNTEWEPAEARESLPAVVRA